MTTKHWNHVTSDIYCYRDTQFVLIDFVAETFVTVCDQVSLLQKMGSLQCSSGSCV